MVDAGVLGVGEAVEDRTGDARFFEYSCGQTQLPHRHQSVAVRFKTSD